MVPAPEIMVLTELVLPPVKELFPKRTEKFVPDPEFIVIVAPEPPFIETLLKLIMELVVFVAVEPATRFKLALFVMYITGLFALLVIPVNVRELVEPAPKE